LSPHSPSSLPFTLFHAAAILQRSFPHACADYGGTKVILSGPGLNSVCKVPEACLRSALVAAKSQATADAAAAAYMPRKDATGMYAISGVYVRWTCHFDAVTAGASRDVRRALQDREVHFSRAYYAVGADFSGFETGDGSGAAAPYPFRARMDGSLFHATPDSLQLDLDSLQTIAPAVSRPCSATVEIVVVDGARGEAALRSLPEDAAVLGSVRFDFFTQPALQSTLPAALSVSPGSGASPTVQLVGEHLFGCALVDPMARGVAEQLVAEVQAEVARREAAEAAKLAAELAALDAGTAPPAASRDLGLLHFSRAAGTAAQPTDVLVTFDVIVGGTKRGRTDATRGYYVVAYDEHVVDVRSAAREIASAATGRLFTGASAPRSTPVRGGPRPGAAAAQPSEDEVEGKKESDVGDGDADESEGIVGTYSATIVCAVPDLSEMLTGTNLPALPDGVAQVVAALYAGGEAAAALTPDQLEAARAAPYPSLLGGAGGAAAAGKKAAGGMGDVALIPRFSPNGGLDWLDAPPGVSVRVVKPEPAVVTPPSALLAESIALSIRGAGFVPGSAAGVTVYRLDADGSRSSDGVTCAAKVADGSTVSVRVPSLAGLLPAASNGGGGSGGEGGGEGEEAAHAAAAAAGPVCGFFSFECDLTVEGLPVVPANPLRFVVYTGGLLASEGASFLAPGGSLSVALAPPSADSYDALSGATAAPTWIPPVAAHGSALAGLSGLGVSLVVTDSAGVAHTLPATFDSAHGSLHGTVDASVAAGALHPAVRVGSGDSARLIRADAAQVVLYVPSALVVTGITGPKKVVPGAEMVAAVDGLHALLTGGGAADPAHPHPHPSASAVVVRLSAGGGAVVEVHPGKIGADNATVHFALPGPGTAIVDDVHVEVSLAGGADGSFTAPFAIKVAKK
jgi:hypothetical protein